MHRFLFILVVAALALGCLFSDAEASQPWGLHVLSGPTASGTDILILSYAGGAGDFPVSVHGIVAGMTQLQKANLIALAINNDGHPVVAKVFTGPGGMPFVSIRHDVDGNGQWDPTDPLCTGMDWRNHTGEGCDEIEEGDWSEDPTDTEDEATYSVSGVVTGITGSGATANLKFGVSDLTVEVPTALFASAGEILDFILAELQAYGINASLDNNDNIVCWLTPGTYEAVRLGTDDIGLESALGLRD